MKTLEIRRHTQRTKPGQDLSRQGISLAKLTAPITKNFDIVATANIPRAIQTASAFGHKVTLLDDTLGHLPREMFEKCAWPNSLSEMSIAISHHKSLAEYAQSQADLWQKIVAQLPPSGSALIISHGAIIELGILSMLPDENHANWGPAIGYCEGIRLEFQNDQICGKFFRVPDEHYQLEN